MGKYYLAIDIGASSGRHILGHSENGKLYLEEIYRFENSMKKTNEGLVWELPSLFENVVSGIAECKNRGIVPISIAIDTWGVDYVLIDADGKEILPAYAYRDSRTKGVPFSCEFPMSYSELYSKTGIQLQEFNTLYQLWCDSKSGRLSNAAHFLMMPDYLAYKLTGVMKNEYTNATTSMAVNAQLKNWDFEILEKAGISKKLFLPLSPPCTNAGMLSQSLSKRVGFNTKVVLAPSHDTAAAVAACPIDEKSIYISSGTWSLMGTELDFPVLSKYAREANFTNEGGIEYRFRFLKNIMGMWLFQNVRRNTGKKYSYDELMNMAKNSSFDKIIDVNHPSLVAPDNMIAAVNALAGEENLPLCDTLSCIYRSLAHMYVKTVREIENISGRSFDSIFIVGGGSKDSYLNYLTGQYCKKTVKTGLSEATAVGNLLSQIMSEEKINLNQARELVKKSFDIKEVYRYEQI